MAIAKRFTGLITLATAGCAIAACGSSGPTTTTAASGGLSQGVRFADCMRSNGVHDFADTSGDGTNFVPSGSSQSPAFKSALKACAKLEPGGGGPPTMSASRRLAALKFAECMRAHGVSGFPDPTLTAPSTLSAGELVINLRGMVFVLEQGLDSQSPAFKHAATECGAGRA